MTPARVIVFGLGPIGVGIAQLALERGHHLVGAVDADPQKAGRPLSDLVPDAAAAPIERTAEPFLHGGVDVVLHSTQSRMTQVVPQLVPLLEAGLAVISTCEELAYPWHHHPAEAAHLDAVAKAHGARLVGLGVNPGFVMDTLPVMLTAPCRTVRRISVERTVDAGQRRVPLQRKVGVGMTVEEFTRGVAQGTMGHVGLPQSVAMIAAVMGWALDEIQESIEPEVDARRAVRGLHQVCRGMRDGEAVVTLDLTMATGVPHPRDRIRIDGVPVLEMVIDGGIHGDVATWSIAVNAIPAVLASAPGLRVATDLPPGVLARV
jgi:4-hydroxy-tetrahydrodipicolinate reductase